MSIAIGKRQAGGVKVIHGASDGVFAVAQMTIAQVRKSLVEAFNIPAEAIALVNGDFALPSYRLQSNDTLEFVQRRGEKSILDPQEQAQLDRIEATLARILGIASHQMTEREEEILQALGNKKLIGEILAKQAGYEYDGHFKATLSSMVKRGIICNDHPGYRQPKSGRGQD